MTISETPPPDEALDLRPHPGRALTSPFGRRAMLCVTWALLPLIAIFVGALVVEQPILSVILWSFLGWLPFLLLWAVIAWFFLRRLRRMASTPRQRLLWWVLLVACAIFVVAGVAMGVGMLAFLSSGVGLK